MARKATSNAENPKIKGYRSKAGKRRERLDKIDENCLDPTILILKAIAVNKDRAYLVLRSDLDLQV